MKDVFRVRRMWRPRGELKKRYDVVIIGGGSHGLATAYYLAKNHGVTNVAVLEQSYIGSGASGRNTTIIRSNYRTPEGAAFYRQSVELYEQLSGELDFNLMFSQHGHLTLAHTDSALSVMQERAEVNQLLGIDSRVVLPRRDRGASARSSTSPTSRPGRSWARSTTRRAGSSATTPSSGASRAAPTAAASRSTSTRPSPGSSTTDGRVTGVADEPRPRRGGRRRQRDRRLVDARLRARRRAPADHDAHPAGVRHRAGEAVPRRDHRVGADARVRVADRPRRVPDRRRDRAVHDLQVDRHVPVPRVLGAARARALPAARAAEGAAHVDGPVRPVARLQPDPRPDRARELPRLGRLGHVRLQGGADRRHDARGARRDRRRRRT